MVQTSQQILDVRVRDADERASVEDDVRAQIIEGLSKAAGNKTLPTILLYDERGLRLYDAITTDCPEYYLFAAEEEILKTKGDEIVRVVHRHDFASDRMAKPVVLELGAGALRKTSHILLALSRLVTAEGLTNFNEKDGEAPIKYFALDLEKSELERTLELLNKAHGSDLKGKVETAGMWGTYDGGLKYVVEGGFAKDSIANDAPSIDDRRGREIDSPEVSSDDKSVSKAMRDASPHSITSDSSSNHSQKTYETFDTLTTPPSSPDVDDDNHQSKRLKGSPPLHILFLGSSLGNFDRESSVAFLRSLPLRPGSRDTLLVGLDHDNDKKKIELAYNDPKGVSKEFMTNGLRAAGRTLGDEGLFAEGKWEFVNMYKEENRRHEGYFKSVTDQTLSVPDTKTVLSFSADELINIEVSHKFSDTDAYSMFTASELRPIMRWTNSSNEYSLWLLERPAFTFPLLKQPVGNNVLEKAGPFSVPSLNDWRTMWKAWDAITLGMIPQNMLLTKPIDLRHICLFYLGHIPAFLDIHLSRLLREKHTEPEYFKDIFERGIDPHVDDPSQCHPHSEVPQNEEDWPTLEMIIGFRDRVRARLAALYDDLSSGRRQLTRKIGRVLFMTLEHEGFHAETLLYMLLQGAGKTGGTMPPPGFASPPWEALAEHWNSAPLPNESTVVLGPATVALGHDDNEAEDAMQDNSDSDNMEEKFSKVKQYEFGWDNEHPKREVEVGQFKISWRPVTNGEYYAFWKGEGRDMVKIPGSWVEVDGVMKVRTLYGPVDMNIAQHWPVLTSYDDMSKYAVVGGGRLPTEAELRLFYDKFSSGYEGGANIGFRNWHSIPATTGLLKHNGKGHNGGVWEWTSTLFDKYEGFVNSTLYPGYSSDFFDGKHMVVIGGSYATIPRLAERRSLRNYYQHNYPYPWVSGRIVYDV